MALDLTVAGPEIRIDAIADSWWEEVPGDGEP
jgi:hypothetical protein